LRMTLADSREGFDTQVMSRRVSGVLLHITSLPGAGDLGPEAYRFVDFLAEAGQSVWMMLPVGPPGGSDSPYAARSAFAGDPLLVSLERLSERGWLDESAVSLPPQNDPHSLDSRAIWNHKLPRFREAFSRFMGFGGDAHLARFEAARPWLREYATFAALRELSAEPWWKWSERFRDPSGVPAYAGTSVAEEVQFHQFIQYCFDEQWRSLRTYANRKGIALWGDVPIFVDRDSADHWANQHLYKLDADGNPTVVSGVPPDAFSETGQRWGNPVYDWPANRADGYRWWVERFRRTFDMFDAVRVDHFRGFESYWEIPADEETAINGSWVPGPGRELFDRLSEAMGKLPIIVEDLGLITDEVRALRDSLGYPGMSVLQFAFGGDPNNPYLPQNHIPNQVAFTGTHDNDTTLGWWKTRGPEERANVLKELGSDGTDVVDDMVRAAFGSVAESAIIPMQDVLKLGGDARMNFPGKIEGNWHWRFTWDQPPEGRTAWLASLAEKTGRNRVLQEAK
jgi:4-alpha-glucanotransferase